VTFVDGVRLAFGTFTVIPVRPPRRVGAATARVAILLAPVVGALLGIFASAVLAAIATLGGGDLLAAALAVAALALLTRGLHLDGLADVADGLGSGRDPASALSVMRRPDIGSFGALSLLLVVVTQVAALARSQQLGFGSVAVVLAVLVGRVGVVVACTAGIPAARTDGLGASVAGTVPKVWAAGWTIGLLSVAAVYGAWHPQTGAAPLVVSSLGGLFLAALLLRHCLRRLGGVTGDVLGAVCETATTGTLVLMALAN
jgi:adenosylcobinamide-GDP ribazoletransferase